MNFLNNVKEVHIRGLLAIIIVLAVIIGFFTGAVPIELFSTLSGAVLMYYFQGKQIVKLEKEKESVEAELQSVQATVESLSVKDG